MDIYGGGEVLGIISGAGRLAEIIALSPTLIHVSWADNVSIGSIGDVQYLE